MTRPISVFWRVFIVNAGLLGVLAALLLFSPVEIHDPIRPTQALIVVAGLVVTLTANVLLLTTGARAAGAAGAENGDGRPAPPRPTLAGPP